MKELQISYFLMTPTLKTSVPWERGWVKQISIYAWFVMICRYCISALV